MEVTKSNFYQLIPTIKEALDTCDFIAIDCELTGLNTINNINAFDSQKQYYEKVRKNSKDFLIIQYGLCIFRYDNEQNVYKQQGYNFYIFQRSMNKHVPDHRFLCQSSSIDFLATCEFDFNKLFKEGIPYLNGNEEDRYRESLSDVQKMRLNQMQNSFTPDKSNQNISITIEDKTLVNNIFKEIQDFITSDEEERVLPKCNAYIRRLVYNEAQMKLLNKASLETRVLENKDRALIVTRLKTKNQKEDANRKTIEMEEEEFKKCIGFSTIIKMIVESGKLVIGHNMCLDLLHTINQFLTPLPFDYEEFKELAHYSFSKVLDTKYMCNVVPLKHVIDSSVLTRLLATVLKEPFKIPDLEIEENMMGYTLTSSKEHEAGYDAFITGVSFLAMWDYLHGLEEPNKKKSYPDVSLLEPYYNRLYLMRLQDYPYIHLGTKDLQPSRDHIVYLSFPKTWKQNDIFQLFSPFGNVFIAWIDDHSAYVALQRKDQISVVLSTLSQSDTYTIMSYDRHQAELGGQIKTTTPIQKKRLANNINSSVKKRKMSFGNGNVSSNKITLDQSLKILSTPKETPTKDKKHVKKTFAESIDWD